MLFSGSISLCVGYKLPMLNKSDGDDSVLVELGIRWLRVLVLLCALFGGSVAAKERYNVLFIIADDLAAGSLACYGNTVCKTPHIDKLASDSVRYSRAFCQYPVCGPSRASLMTGYYPHATKTFGYVSGRKPIGKERATWSEYFKNAGYYTARVSKIYHMAVPGDIVRGSNGADDKASWSERFNSKGPEVWAEGEGERLERNLDGKRSYGGGNHLEYVKAEGGDLVHSDGITAKKACELIKKHGDEPFFLAVGMVRPHVPFVAPRGYYQAYPWQSIVLPEWKEDDWDDIPKAGINYKTSVNLQLDEAKEKKAIAAYYASVSYMDTQVGKVLQALREEGLEEKTIVIFTSDHGFHLAEHRFWMKVGLMDESVQVPLIIKVPGKKPAVCESFAELVDLYPTVSELCGLEIPDNIQGKSLVKTLSDPSVSVRDFAFSVNSSSFLIRNDKWSYIQHGEDGRKGSQLYEVEKDPKQFTNLVRNPEYATQLDEMRRLLAEKLAEVRENDLEIDYRPEKSKLEAK